MKSRNSSLQRSLITGLALALALAAYSPSAHANVYASNIRIKGVLSGSVAVAQGIGANISYILNEPASLGLTIQIYSGATLVRAIAIVGGNPGTTQGLNTVFWDGKDNLNANVPVGNYTVTVTAVSSGYLDWTEIVTSTSVKAYWPSGIAVDLNTNSPYYGRVMVANGVNTANNVAPHPVGILKFNADASEADEGQSGAGVSFRTDPYLADSVRSLKYIMDDRVVFNDWVGDGKATACDMIMSTNQLILDTDAAGAPGNFADIDITNIGTTNALIWFADGGYPSAGIWCWPMTNNGIADPTATGINVLVTGGADMPVRSGYGIIFDEAGNLYVGETRSNPTDASVKLASITNLWPSAVDGSPTNWWNTAGTYPISSGNINWQDGAELNSTFCDVSDVSLDSRTSPKYLSASYSGTVGGLKILNPADGTTVTTINQTSSAFYIATCWDAVGNVYAGDANHTTPWHAFSPPGANQATTPAVVIAHVVVPPHISSIGVSGGTATINFTAGATDPSSAFKLFSCSIVNGIYTDAGAVITGSGGTYAATVAAGAGPEFYRIARQP